MKLSDQPTSYLLLNARTNSEWDNCDFAIVHISENWKTELQRRLKSVEPFAKDFTLHCISFYDYQVQFYQDNETIPDSLVLREEKEWSFLSITKKELEALSLPESTLDCHIMNITWGGLATFKCYGKHTNEEFWTSEFSIKEVIELLTNEHLALKS